MEKGKTMSDMAMKYEDWLRGCVHHEGRKGNVYLPCDTVLAIADWIEAHRDVAPVRHGRWMDMKGFWMCSECHKDTLNLFNYCPYCGAKMDGDADD